MAILIFIIGTILGSFYLVVGTRLPIKEDIIKSRSRCDNCRKTLKWYNLIPLFSYLFQKGKCSFCKKKISSDHFWIELGTGLLFLFSYLYFGISYNFYIGIIISTLLILILVSDIKYMIILDSPLLVSSILIIILKYYYFDLTNVYLSFLSGIVLFLTMLLVQKFGNLVFKKESMGGGDIKFTFIMGLTLGIKLGLTALVLSAFLALPYAVASLYLNKQSEFPYGPFLAGALLVVFYYYDKFELLINFLFPSLF